jgi:hypothetical protein
VCFLFFFKSRGGGAAPDFVQGGKTLRFFLFSIPHMEEKGKKKFTPELEKKPQDRLTEFPHASTFFRSFSPILYFVSFICVIAIFQQQFSFDCSEKKKQKKTEEETLFFFLQTFC